MPALYAGGAQMLYNFLHNSKCYRLSYRPKLLCREAEKITEFLCALIVNRVTLVILKCGEETVWTEA